MGSKVKETSKKQEFIGKRVFRFDNRSKMLASIEKLSEALKNKEVKLHSVFNFEESLEIEFTTTCPETAKKLRFKRVG